MTTGVQGFWEWLSSDPTGQQIASQIAPTVSALAAQTSASGELPATRAASARLAPALQASLAQAIGTLPANQQAAAGAAIGAQLQRAASGQAPLNVGMLYMGTSIIRLGNTCLTLGATELQGGTLLLVLAGAALVVGLILFHGRKKS